MILIQTEKMNEKLRRKERLVCVECSFTEPNLRFIKIAEIPSLLVFVFGIPPQRLDAMDTGETMAKTTTTTIETFTLSDAHRDIDRSDARTHQRPILTSIDKSDAENVSINALDRRHVNNNDSSNESIGRLSPAGSSNSAAAAADVDHSSTTKNKRKNFQPRSTAAADEDAARGFSDAPATESVQAAPSAAFKSTETQISAGHPAAQPTTNNTAFNAIKELLNVYGLSMSPNDIVDAFNRTLEMDAIKELAKSREYWLHLISYLY